MMIQWLTAFPLAQISSDALVVVPALYFTQFILALTAMTLAGMWKTFAKAGEPGWGAIVPFFNIYLLCRIARRPGWWLVLFLIPVVSLVISIIVYLDIARNFGKDTLFALGLIFLSPIFFMILGFGAAPFQPQPH